MVKMLSGILLKRRIKNYVNRILTKPQKKLGGLSICPFLKFYKDDIQITICDDYEVKVSQACQLLHSLGLEAIVIGGPMMDYDECMGIVAYYNSLYYKKNVEILLMHPDTVDSPLPLEYNFKYSPLFIVQNAKTLNNAREQLKKNGKYYNYYK